MKRKLFLLIGIIVIACMILNVALAESWTCPNCGALNSGNYCSNCGTSKPASGESSTITNVTFSPLSNGDISVQWDDSSSTSPYTIKYATEYWDVAYKTNSVTGKRVIMEYLIPGVTYQITISNGISETTETYEVPRPIFTEFITGGKYLNLTMERFSLSEIEEKPTMTFEVRVSWPQLKHSREYTAKLVLNTPYGYVGKVFYYSSFTLENKYSYTYMTFSITSDWLDDVEEAFGSIPTGEYTFEIYMDGQLYDYAPFMLYN